MQQMYVYNVPAAQLGKAITALLLNGNGHAAAKLLAGHNWLNQKAYVGVSPVHVAGLSKWQVVCTCGITRAALQQWANFMLPLALHNARQAQPGNTYPAAHSLFNGALHGPAHNGQVGYWLFNMPAGLPPMPGQ